MASDEIMVWSTPDMLRDAGYAPGVSERGAVDISSMSQEQRRSILRYLLVRNWNEPPHLISPHTHVPLRACPTVEGVLAAVAASEADVRATEERLKEERRRELDDILSMQPADILSHPDRRCLERVLDVARWRDYRTDEIVHLRVVLADLVLADKERAERIRRQMDRQEAMRRDQERLAAEARAAREKSRLAKEALRQEAAQRADEERVKNALERKRERQVEQMAARRRRAAMAVAYARDAWLKDRPGGDLLALKLKEGYECLDAVYDTVASDFVDRLRGLGPVLTREVVLVPPSADHVYSDSPSDLAFSVARLARKMRGVSFARVVRAIHWADRWKEEVRVDLVCPWDRRIKGFMSVHLGCCLFLGNVL
jgi:hypothetical protein